MLTEHQFAKSISTLSYPEFNIFSFMKKSFKFSKKDKQKIQEAVKEAEKKTSGEIVCYFTDKSDNYIQAPTIAAIAVSVIMLIFLNILSQLKILTLKFDSLQFSIVLITPKLSD